MAEERVRVERLEGGIADVRMVRTDKLNACDIDMFVALVETGRELAEDASLRAAVLSGEGRAFCAGIDIPSLMAGGGKRKGPNLTDRTDESPASFVQRSAWIWQEVPVPVIAAVHGVAYGAGFQIAEDRDGLVDALGHGTDTGDARLVLGDRAVGQAQTADVDPGP